MNALVFYSKSSNFGLGLVELRQNIKPVFQKLLPQFSVLGDTEKRAIAVAGNKLVAGNTDSSVAMEKKYFVIKDLDNPIASQPLVGFGGNLNGVDCSHYYYVLFGSLPYIRVYDWQDNFINLSTQGLGDVISATFDDTGKRLFILHNNAPYLRMYDIKQNNYIDRTEQGDISTKNIHYIDGMLWFADYRKAQLLSYDDQLNNTTLKNIRHSFLHNNYYRYIIKHPTKDNIVLLHNYNELYEYNLIDHGVAKVLTFISNINYISLISDKIFISINNYENRGVLVYNLDYTLNEEYNQQLFFLKGYHLQFVYAKFNTSKISGIVRDVNNTVASRTIRAYSRNNGELVAQTQSNLQGEYVLELNNSEPTDVQFMAQDGELLNDLFYANVIPELIP